MTYYTPDNPNHALLPRPRKHPVREGIRITLVILLSLLLVLSLTLTLFSAAVRNAITPEYVYRYVDSIDFTEFPLPVDGSFTTISQLMLETFNAAGFNLQASDIALLFDQFSVPVVFAGFAQDVTTWFLQNGTRPVLDPEEIASIALSGVDDSIMAILYFLGDPTAILSKILVTPLSTIDTDSLFDRLEPVRLLLSADALAMLVSISLLLGVLLFCLCRCRFSEFCLPLFIVLLFVSLSVGLSGFSVTAMIPHFTEVYAGYLASFLQPVCILLWRFALSGVIIALIPASIWFFCLLSRRLNQRKVWTDTDVYPL